jgi:CPA1 family monovalent cation:H+ antiporter
MTETGVHGAQLVLLLLLLLVTAFSALARRLQTPYPIVLVIAGLLLSFIPGIPRVTLDPQLVFLVVLPPLLYAAAWQTSWRDLSCNFVNVAMLAFGLVAFTAAGVAVAGPWLFGGFDWRIGFVLGAAVATTDSIAATSIAKRIGLPKLVRDLLEGESLLNDATGLLALEFATSLVVEGRTPTVGGGLLRLAYLIAGGVGVGLIAALLVEWFERRIDDGPIEIGVSILVPYTAYLTSEALHASGVLAVVTAGLYLSRKSSQFFSPGVRLQAYAVWQALEFILNGFVFVLIGLQLPSVLEGVRELTTGKALLYGALFGVFLILLRLLWTFPGAFVAIFIRRRLLHHNVAQPNVRQIFIIGWTGMRGVLALAAAMSLPSTRADGTPFPHRDLIVFLTFSVILVTLLGQGMTLPFLIRWLRLAQNSESIDEEQMARRETLQAAVSRLEEIRRNDPAGPEALYDDVALHYRSRLASINRGGAEEDQIRAAQFSRYVDVSRTLLDVERETAVRLRDQGMITDEVLRTLEYELDLAVSRFTAINDHTHPEAAPQ